MEFVAKSRFVRFSPFKLRPIVDVVRGKNVQQALNWLSTHAVQRVVPIQKVLESAVANAKHLQDIAVDDLAIKDIRVDQGSSYRYFKPGAMGRSNPQKKRFSHISVVLERAAQKKSRKTRKLTKEV